MKEWKKAVILLAIITSIIILSLLTDKEKIINNKVGVYQQIEIEHRPKNEIILEITDEDNLVKIENIIKNAIQFTDSDENINQTTNLEMEYTIYTDGNEDLAYPTLYLRFDDTTKTAIFSYNGHMSEINLFRISQEDTTYLKNLLNINSN